MAFFNVPIAADKSFVSLTNFAHNKGSWSSLLFLLLLCFRPVRLNSFSDPLCSGLRYSASFFLNIFTSFFGFLFQALILLCKEFCFRWFYPNTSVSLSSVCVKFFFSNLTGVVNGIRHRSWSGLLHTGLLQLWSRVSILLLTA